MFAQSLISWDGGIDLRERVARFLNPYSVFITIHTDKENVLFHLIEERGSLSEEEHSLLLKHYITCHDDVGGKARVDQMTKLLAYLKKKNG